MVFSDILSRDDLALFLGVKKSHLTYVLYKKKVDSYYTSFEIPKKTEGTRQINAPTGMLKSIQVRLATALCNHQNSLRIERKTKTNISHAFEKKKSIITNAQIDRNKLLILNLDLENFFESFHFGRVAGYFEKNRDFDLPHDVAIIIAQLTCYKGHLPQGAPTSPIITNLLCQILDMRILRIAKRYKLDYTRYADDMTFSTNNRAFLEQKESFLHELENEIVHAGFAINQNKTRLALRDSRQTVTGLIVNQKLNVPAEYYKKTRAMAHQLYTEGRFYIDGKEGSIAQLEGRFSFIDQLSRYNNKRDTGNHSCHSLSSREKQYRAFLFYKYFYANEKPLIVTEGKTDIRYIRAALKKMWDRYPELIIKKANGEFEFKVAFLHRTKKLEYFLKIAPDGANTLNNIYNYYSDKYRDFPNYYSFFSKMRKHPSQHPIVLLFDNEVVTGKRPLYEFLKHIQANDNQRQILSSDLHLRLISESNLYLWTNPLVDGMKECEIEFLFRQETRDHQMGGKSLNLKDNFDISKYYGKDIFSQYISQNYIQVDFDGFIPLLDTLVQIIKSHQS